MYLFMYLFICIYLFIHLLCIYSFIYLYANANPKLSKGESKPDTWQNHTLKGVGNGNPELHKRREP